VDQAAQNLNDLAMQLTSMCNNSRSNDERPRVGQKISAEKI
jgi:hypothetical protein